jgi:hypothetical protein
VLTKKNKNVKPKSETTEKEKQFKRNPLPKRCKRRLISLGLSGAPG